MKKNSTSKVNSDQQNMERCEDLIKQFFKHLIRNLYESSPLNFLEFVYELRRIDIDSNDFATIYIM